MSATPKIIMQPVKSSQFAAIGHIPELSVLAIQFHPKKSTGQSDIYHYQGVSAEMFEEFLGAESQGSFFIQFIKKYPDLFPFEKIDQTAFSHVAAPVVSSLAESVAAPVLSKEMLALALNGRQTGGEITAEEELQAKAAGLVVIFGASDDLMVLSGAFEDEFSCYNGATALIDAKGLLPKRADITDDAVLKDFFAREPGAKKIEALWCDSEDAATWAYSTAVPHATFEIMDGDQVYCRGFVMNVVDLGSAA